MARFTLVAFLYWLFVLDVVQCFNECLPTVDRIPNEVYTILGDKVSIQCPIKSEYLCSMKISIIWLKNGKEINNTISKKISSNDSHILTIKDFRVSDEANYSCIYVEYEKRGNKLFQYGMRSLNISLKTAEIPKLHSKRVTVKIYENTVLHCFERDNDEHKPYLKARWFRENIEITSSHGRYVLFGNILIILNSQLNDKGDYICEVSIKGASGITKRSRAKQTLDIKQGYPNSEDHLQIIHISYGIIDFPNRYLNVICVANKNSSVAILKDNGNHLVKLSNSNSFVNYTVLWKPQEYKTKYVCKTENAVKIVSDQINVDGMYVFNEKGYNYILTKTKSRVKLTCGIDKSFFRKSDYKIIWYLNGYELENAEYIHNRELVIHSISEDDTGIYQCFVEGSNMYLSKSYNLEIEKELLATNFTVNVIDDMLAEVYWEKPSGKSHGINEDDIFYELTGHCMQDGLYNNQTKQTNISKKSIEIICPSCGGYLCKFEICTIEKSSPEDRHCIHTERKMKSKKPSKPPKWAMPPQEYGKAIILKWDISLMHTNGKILKYILFVQNLDSQNYGEIKEVEISGNINMYKLQLSSHGIIKIWLQAFNIVGGSPFSEAFLVDPKNLETPNISIKGTSICSENYPVIVWRVERNKWKPITGFMLYVTKLPYVNYWNSTSLFRVKANANRLDLKELSKDFNYRITIISFYEKKYLDEGSACEDIGKIVNFLSPSKDKYKYINKESDSKARSLTCLPISELSILFSWMPSEDGAAKVNYRLHLINEKSELEILHTVSGASVNDTFILVKNLHDRIYHARLESYLPSGSNQKEFTEFITCSTKQRAPSPVTNLTHWIVHDQVEDKIYLSLQWKPPLYSGDPLYYYSVAIKAIMKIKGILKIETDLYLKRCIAILMDNAVKGEYLKTGYIKVKPIPLKGKAEYEVIVAAKTDYVSSINEKLPTKHISLPNRTEIIQTIIEKLQKNELQDLNSSEVRTGVVVGISIALTFLLLFLIVIVYLRCKPSFTKYHLERRISLEQEQVLMKSPTETNSDTFLYLRKLKELNKDSSDIDGSIDLSECDRKRRCVSCFTFEKLNGSWTGSSTFSSRKSDSESKATIVYSSSSSSNDRSDGKISLNFNSSNINPNTERKA